MKAFKAIATTLATLLLVLVLQQRLFNLPPIGSFLNPTSGIWKNATLSNRQANAILTSDKLNEHAEVKYDTSLVPHIIASNEYDLYFMQGYITATERLWQMDIQVRKAAGRLSEVFGAATLEQDIYFRRLQLQTAAQKSLDLMSIDCNIKNMLTAYSDGVNAYIDQLKDADLPVEYKLFDHQPEKWLPVNSVLIMKLMAETLAGGSDDFEMSQVLQHFGKATTSDLFPNSSYKEDPVIPAGTLWNFTAKPALQPQLGASMPVADVPAHAPRNEGIGSNNWAVSGKKSRSGYPLLANDPHLRLTLPSIWYQVQLIGPVQNVYGVSMPGIPSVVIGFNSNIAWGVTNVYADVMDWYSIEFRDETCREYAYDGRWIPVREKNELIKIRGGGAVNEKILLTHYGPVFSNKIQPNDKTRYALKWIAHEPSQEIASFYYINRANDYASFRQALSYFTAPAQSFVYADKFQHIAMVCAGKYPHKQSGQGKYVMDGSDPANEWNGWIPADEVPSVIDPARQFVSSANQSLTDSTYPYYINWKFSPAERARRINARLGVMQQATTDSLRMLQNDKYSVVAEDVLPFLLLNVPYDQCTPEQQQTIQLLKKWDKNLFKSSAQATFFNAWWGNLYEAIWSDDFNTAQGNLQKPSRDRTIKLLLEEPNAPWFDDKRTPKLEHANDLIINTFKYTADSLVKKFGSPGSEWEWGKHKASIIEHVGKVGSFGTGFFSSEGSAGTVDALSKNFGPSWRMVIELGEDVRAYGILPGGQSGNPGSYYYDNLLNEWKAGKLRPLTYLKNASDSSAKIKSVLTFKN
ncbi:MAG: penicillin acylase family protein [Chitinophagaceae bacterium]